MIFCEKVRFFKKDDKFCICKTFLLYLLFKVFTALKIGEVMNSLKLKIPSLVENVRIVESFIEDAKEKFNFNDDVYGNIMIAVTESVNNAIIHGNKCDKTKDVLVSLSIMPQSLKFTIKDQGKGFSIENLPDPTAPENLLKPGGRGIFLIKHLADEVEFSDNGTCVSMTFHINET